MSIIGGIPSSWKGWMVGMTVTVVIPLLTNKWGALLNWTRKIESTVERVDDMVETVEEVAEKVEKLTENIMDELPDGKLKTALCLIEHVAVEIAKDAQQIDNLIHKVEKVENKLEAYIEAEEERNVTAPTHKHQKQIN